MTTTFLCALRSTGRVAPLVINGEPFLAWIRQQLVPTLRPGDSAVMDYLSAHKVACVADAIREEEASVLYLPHYSPDLNPIENVFAKVTHYIRKRRPRTKSECDTLCGESLDWF